MKIVSALMLAVFLTVLSSCSAPEQAEELSDLELVLLDEGNYLRFYDLEALEDHSEIVAVGTFAENSAQEVKYKYMEYFDKEVVFSVMSFNEIKVEKVIKGDVKEGDTLKIGQEYAEKDGRFISESALTPMMKGDKWLFFLEPSDSGEFYFCVGYSEGRYPVKDTSYKRIALTENEDLGVFNEKDFNYDIYNEILERYDLS
ncbi:MAG: hypothetical protein NC394_06595 [Bacteroides sp.]|nr:hypothetical protein [Bacteroides sp.]